MRVAGLRNLLLTFFIVEHFDQVAAFSNNVRATSVAYVQKTRDGVASRVVGAAVPSKIADFGSIVGGDNVAIVSGDVKGVLNAEQKTQLKALLRVAPKLVEMWLALVIEKEMINRVEVQELIKDIGPIPKDDEGKMGKWIVRVMRPLVDISGAFSVCQNDFQRMEVANTALEASIDNMSGKRVAFFNL